MGLQGHWTGSGGSVGWGHWMWGDTNPSHHSAACSSAASILQGGSDLFGWFLFLEKCPPPKLSLKCLCSFPRCPH